MSDTALFRAYAGLALHGALFVALAGICAFDDGGPASDWTDCLIPLGLLLVPLAIAVGGVVARSSRLLIAAAVTGLILAFLTLTGPGLFVAVPAILYGAAAASGPGRGRRDADETAEP